jgi:hypothetical protein
MGEKSLKEIATEQLKLWAAKVGASAPEGRS